LIRFFCRHALDDNITYCAYCYCPPPLLACRPAARRHLSLFTLISDDYPTCRRRRHRPFHSPPSALAMSELAIPRRCWSIYSTNSARRLILRMNSYPKSLFLLWLVLSEGTGIVGQSEEAAACNNQRRRVAAMVVRGGSYRAGGRD